MSLPYWVVDAFTDRLFAGNPAAVVLPGEALPDALMASIAAENNLSETAFAVPEGEDENKGRLLRNTSGNCLDTHRWAGWNDAGRRRGRASGWTRVPGRSGARGITTTG